MRQLKFKNQQKEDSFFEKDPDALTASDRKMNQMEESDDEVMPFVTYADY